MYLFSCLHLCHYFIQTKILYYLFFLLVVLISPCSDVFLIKIEGQCQLKIGFKTVGLDGQGFLLLGVVNLTKTDLLVFDLMNTFHLSPVNMQVLFG